MGWRGWSLHTLCEVTEHRSPASADVLTENRFGKSVPKTARLGFGQERSFAAFIQIHIYIKHTYIHRAFKIQGRLPAVCFPAQIFALKVARCLSPCNAELQALAAGPGEPLQLCFPHHDQWEVNFFQRFLMSHVGSSASQHLQPGCCRGAAPGPVTAELLWFSDEPQVSSELCEQTALSAVMSVHPNPTPQSLN